MFAHPLIRSWTTTRKRQMEGVGNWTRIRVTGEPRNLWYKKWICDVFAVQIKFIAADTYPFAHCSGNF